MDIFDLYSKIYNCKICSKLAILEANKNKFKYGGYINAKYMWIAQNPGYVINKKTECVFPINNNNNSEQDKFTKYLDDIGMYELSYFTNLVKCSTINNIKPNDEEISNCFNYIEHEINIIKPKIIITLGNLAKNIINNKYKDIKIYNLYHPTYVFSYNKNLIDSYKKQILNIFNTN